MEGNFPYFYHSGGDNINFINEPILNKETLKAPLTGVFRYSLDLSNPLLEITDFTEVKMNAILSEMETGANSIIVSNPIYLSFLSQAYPNYYFIGSEKYRDKGTIDLLKSIRVNYENLNDEYYKDIPKNKLDLNITQKCSKCCKEQQELCFKEHYQSLLMFMEYSNIKDCNKPIAYFNNSELQDLIKQGYNHFHINTYSTNDLDFIIDLYLDVFIKPEYRDIMRGELMV